MGFATILEQRLDHIDQRKLQFKRSNSNFRNNDATSIAASRKRKEIAQVLLTWLTFVSHVSTSSFPLSSLLEHSFKIRVIVVH